MEPKNDWKKFRRLKVDTKSLNKRLRRAETVSTKHAHRFVLKRLTSLRDARRHIISWLLLASALIVITAVQLVWFQNSYKVTANISGGTYSEGMIGDFETLNPLYAQSLPEQSASRLIFSSLYDYDDTGNLRADAAKSTSIDESGTKYIVTLRDDVKWHDGTKLTADDIIFTIGLIKNPATRTYLYESWVGITVKKVDTYVVEFTLPSPFASFAHFMTFAVLPKHIIESVEPSSLRENTFSMSPVGSGPFKLRLLQTIGSDDQRKVAHMTRWDEYHRGEPKLNRFEIHSFAENAGVITAFKARDINAMVDVEQSEEDFSNTSQLVERSQSIRAGVYAMMNTESPILRNPEVRRALRAGIDLEALRSDLSYKADEFDLPVAREQITTTSIADVPDFNAEEAGRLLDKAGWKLDAEGKRTKGGEELKLRLVWAKSLDYTTAANSLINQWKKLGITVERFEFDASMSDQSFAQAVLRPRAYDVLINELAIGADLDVLPYWHSSQVGSSGFNFANYKSAIADDALTGARIRPERDLREQKYKVFIEQWIKDAPAIGLYQSTMKYVQRTGDVSFKEDIVLPSFTDRYADIQTWTTEVASVYKTP